jgi:2,5-diketo-D-gluconate reductase A
MLRASLAALTIASCSAEDATAVLRERITLNDGQSMPRVGLGVYKSGPGDETYGAVAAALDAGYRMVDTASLYRNEESVGKAIADFVARSGVPRAEIYVTTKLWGDGHGFEQALAACDASLRKLGLAYVDLFLIHAPLAGKVVETWDALQLLKLRGKAKSVGVSNFGAAHLQALLDAGRPVPAVNQLELHPLNWGARRELVEGLHAQHGILTQAYGSLFAGQKQHLQSAAVAGVVAAHPGKTAAQVVLRWALQKGFQVIPKSVSRGRIVENAQLGDFALGAAEVAALDAMQGTAELGEYWDPLGSEVDVGDTSHWPLAEAVIRGADDADSEQRRGEDVREADDDRPSHHKEM